ncbi:hypothetical protein F66182_6996, partial [Fusarium sp. NRRL 66182]
MRLYIFTLFALSVSAAAVNHITPRDNPPQHRGDCRGAPICGRPDQDVLCVEVSATVNAAISAGDKVAKQQVALSTVIQRLTASASAAMPRIKAPPNLPELVKSTFAKACSEGDLHYFPTKVTILDVDSIPFQLRFSPALASKPRGPPKDLSKPQKPFDPFADPLPALKVTDLGPSHYLVLNKFAVVPEHFILATTDFKSQTHVLEESDLEATLACIETYEAARRTETEQGHRDGSLGGGDGLYAFFNCGEHSGASQPHRHIQLLPVARMKDGFEPDAPWSVL